MKEGDGDGLDAGRVRLFALPVWNRAFVAGPRLVVWPARAARLDFAAPDVPLFVQGVFVHELTHVWQAQNGVRLLRAKLRAGDSHASYAYDLSGELSGAAAFASLNIEQQAMVVQHAFLASRGAAAPHALEIYARIRSAWRRG